VKKVTDSDRSVYHVITANNVFQRCSTVRIIT